MVDIGMHQIKSMKQSRWTKELTNGRVYYTKRIIIANDTEDITIDLFSDEPVKMVTRADRFKL